MCIAGIKPSGVEVPDLETIERCWNANKDGAGVAYPVKGGVQIRKGFASAKEMHEFLTKYSFKDTPVLIHFRIGTHGKTKDPTHTHPFPVGASQEDMEKLAIKAQKALIHNGIMSSFDWDRTQSDTMLFASECFPEIYKIENPRIRKLVIEEMIGTSKIATLTPDGEVEKWGTWITDADTGMLWSNTSYKKYAPLGVADPRGWQGYSYNNEAYGRYVSVGGRQVYKTRREIEEMEKEEALEKKGCAAQDGGECGDDLMFMDEEVVYEVEFLDGRGFPPSDEFWSDYITINDYDVNELEAQYAEIRQYCPPGTKSCPVGMTMFEFDTYVTWLWHNSKISDQEFAYYTYHFSLPEEEV